MTLTPRRDADHQTVVTTLALLTVDHPESAAVIRALVTTLYGGRGEQAYDAILREKTP